ncbi:hypothetical protein [Flavobacterium sp.]|uniref:hypothetical protein n=1 Tax=Flavobacterium sp. TaxID=239 RepID=UPI0031DAE4F0
MFGDHVTAHRIAFQFMGIDMKCRAELQKCTLVSERDYVTAFGTRIRDSLFHDFDCYSQTLRPAVEQENGVDGIIVFKFGNDVKIGMFEAKRPQLKHKSCRWDYLSGGGLSHFTEQIENQRKWRDVFAIWEMFMNEMPDGHLSPPFEHFGSTCIWHNDAFRYAAVNALYLSAWTTDHLKILAAQDSVNLYTIIYNIVICKRGRRLTVNPADSSVTVLNPADNSFSMEVPLPSARSRDDDSRIASFLERNNLDHYTFVDLAGNKEHLDSH